MKLSTSDPIKKNANHGYYIRGKPFTELEWYRIIAIYETATKNGEKCTNRRIRELPGCSNTAEARAIEFRQKGFQRRDPLVAELEASWTSTLSMPQILQQLQKICSWMRTCLPWCKAAKGTIDSRCNNHTRNVLFLIANKSNHALYTYFISIAVY